VAAFDDCIVFLLAKAYQKAQGIFKGLTRDLGLTPVQTLVLMALSEEEGVSAGELGRKLGLDNATLSGVLDRLAEASWVVKEAAEDDRRVLCISLTARGRKIIRTLLTIRDNVNEEVLGGLKLEEKLLLKRMLRDLQK